MFYNKEILIKQMLKFMPLKNKNQVSIQDAIILAAGYGKRMGDLTQNTPKPLVNFFDRPFIEHILRKLQQANIKNIHINHHYLGEQICHFIEEYKKQTPKNNYYLYKEEKLLGTGGSVKHMGHKIALLNRDICPGPILVHNVDVIVPNDKLYEAFLKTWDNDHMDVLLFLCPVKQMTGFEGGADYIHSATDSHNNALQCTRVKDKNKSLLDRDRGYVFTGIHLFHPRILDYIDHNVTNLVDVFDHAEKTGRLGVFIQNKENIFHVGTKISLIKAHKCLKNTTCNL